MCFKPRGEPHAVYQGSYLVPILVRLHISSGLYVLFCPMPRAVETFPILQMSFQAEALAIPSSARLDRISEFLRFGPVTFDTLVLHTGSGDIVPLSTYFNRHLTKLEELNDLFFAHAAQEDGIVPSEVETSKSIMLQCVSF